MRFVFSDSIVFRPAQILFVLGTVTNMKKTKCAAECIQEAQRCEQMAGLITDHALRSKLIEIAHIWREMAVTAPVRISIKFTPQQLEL